MSWKKSLRAVNSGLKKMERESNRIARENLRKQKAAEKAAEHERVANEVLGYEDFIKRLTTIHLTEPPKINWEDLFNIEPPQKPRNDTAGSDQFKLKLENFKPNFLNKILQNTEKQLEKLQAKISESESLEEAEFQKLTNDYNKVYKLWKSDRDLIEKMFTGDEKSIEEAFLKFSDLVNVAGLGLKILVSAQSTDLFELNLIVNDIEIVPKEIRTQLKSGKISVKQMPKTRYFGLYQDHLCSSVLCCAKFVFALLPYKKVIINAEGNLLNTKTGKKEILPLISVYIPIETFETLNLGAIDPSDSMENFVHNMKFVKTKGFSSVDKLDTERFLNI